MFIVSKRNFKLRLADGSVYKIAKDFIGEIPFEVAAHPLIQNAIDSGWITAPASHTDNDLYRADAIAERKAAEADLRPDAVKGKEDTAEAAETAQTGAEKPKTRRKK
jgi:hypothetical protein